MLRRHCERVGRDFDEIIKATTFRVALGSEREVEAKTLKMAKEYNIPVEPIKNRLGAAAGKPDKVADNLKEFFDNGLGLVNLEFIDRDDIPLFAEEVISQIR